MGVAGERRACGGEAKSFLAAIVESSADAIIGKSLDGVITFWNAGAVEMYGYTSAEMVGRSVTKIFPPDREGELGPILAQVRRGEKIKQLETKRVRKDGTVIDVSVSVSPVRDSHGAIVGGATVARDITERNRALAERRASEARLHQAQRMETVGHLAGGIAHEFNNLLGAIVGFAGLVAGASADRPEVRADAEEILAAAQRAAALTKDLLTFSRREPTQPGLVDVNAVLSAVHDLLAAGAGEQVKVRFERSAELPPVLADRGQIEQALVNLAVNAGEAMPTGGTLTFATRQVDLVKGEGAEGAGAAPGRYVELTATDTGCGMSAEVAHRAFEPFFTTKPPGKGTGLGLSTVYGIVTQAGGTVTIDSAEGEGTDFHIFLPAADTRLPRALQTVTTQSDHSGARGETILVVDDEPAVLAVTARILRGDGYRVLEAGSSAEALSLMSSHEFALLLTDAVMSGMSGPELADHAAGLRPGVRVLHMSGATRGVLCPERVASGEVAFIQKPFTVGGLLEKVHAVLEGSPAGMSADASPR
jgi:PAS domain S-box-containing protein